MLKTMPNFAFLTHPAVKIWGGVDKNSIPIVEALPTTEPLNTVLMAIHCVAAERE